MSEGINTPAPEQDQPKAARRRRGSGSVFWNEARRSWVARSTVNGVKVERWGRTRREAVGKLVKAFARLSGAAGSAGERLPSRFITLRDAAVMVGLSESRLSELAAAGYAPHWRVDGGPPVFRRRPLVRWVRDNVLDRCPGRPFPAPIVLHIDRHCLAPAGVPLALAAVSPLFGPPATPRALGSGVYFLCDGPEVVYVGESGEVFARVPHHVTDKSFDRWYWTPVPSSDRLAVEVGYIQALQPKYNRRGIDPGTATPA